jgi:hypothetical protein
MTPPRLVMERVKGIERSYAAWEADTRVRSPTRLTLRIPRVTEGYPNATVPVGWAQFLANRASKG